MSKEIPIIIPWRPGKQLGECMNDHMQKVEDWVLFMDHDVLQLNPNWYYMCQGAIDKVGHSAGWITCITNAIGCHWQRYASNDFETDLKHHVNISKTVFKQKGSELIEPSNYAPFSGFFILTHKQAWERVGGFNNGWMVDNPYDKAIREKGFKRYVMTGLYCYHMYHGKRIFYE